MVVPDEDTHPGIVSRRRDTDIGRGPYTVFEDVVEAQHVAALRFEPVAGELAEHAKGVEHCLVDAIGGEVPEAVEVRLPLEQEGPGDGAVDLDAGAARELVGA